MTPTTMSLEISDRYPGLAHSQHVMQAWLQNPPSRLSENTIRDLICSGEDGTMLCSDMSWELDKVDYGCPCKHTDLSKVRRSLGIADGNHRFSSNTDIREKGRSSKSNCRIVPPVSRTFEQN